MVTYGVIVDDHLWWNLKRRKTGEKGFTLNHVIEFILLKYIIEDRKLKEPVIITKKMYEDKVKEFGELKKHA